MTNKPENKHISQRQGATLIVLKEITSAPHQEPLFRNDVSKNPVRNKIHIF